VQGPRRLVEELKQEHAKKQLFFAYVDATDPFMPLTGNKLPVAFYVSPKLSKDIVVRDMGTQVTLNITEDEE
ncbi:MAG: hypothetical protein RDV41_03455, partial [Planctomycetota bacterium]|nr:hypothetical protein [Planctomycetota bacterium]